MELTIYSSKFEDGFAIENEDGNRLEAVVIHIPGSSDTSFYLGHIQPGEDGDDPTITELFSCPVQAA